MTSQEAKQTLGANVMVACDRAEFSDACKKMVEDAMDVAFIALDHYKMGYWLDHQMDKWIYAKCSECGAVWETKSNFCPTCGADMRSGG